jgi:molecular chaperone GrpE
MAGKKKTTKQANSKSPGINRKKGMNIRMPAENDVKVAEAEAEVNDTFEKSSEDDKLMALTEEKDKFQEQFLRVAAEFENYKKRHAAELERVTTTASEYLIKDLLPVLDDLDLLINNADNSKDYKSLLDGAAMIKQKMFNSFQLRGVEVINSEGEPFDPEIHEALMEQPSADVEPGTVIAVHQVGYRMRGKLLRPSRVIVSKEPD